MISAKGITKSYGTLTVLKDLSMDVARSEIVSIVGKSGSGKSTLLHILGTLDKPDVGTIEINGRDITKLRNKELSRFRNEEIGFVFQFHHLLNEFNALENVTIPALIKGTPLAQTEHRAKEILDYLGLKDRMTHKPGQLSGGEKQRVAVARALINNPSVVFADEPTGNLDSSSADDLHKLLTGLRSEFDQTFIIVTHNDELAHLSDRQLVLVDGQISDRTRDIV